MIQVRAPNGTVVQFPDGTAPGQINSVMAAYHDAAQRVASTPGLVRSVNNGFTGNLMGRIDAAGAAAETGLHNAFAHMTGQPDSGYGMGQAYNAVTGAEHAAQQRFGDEHPILNAAGEIVGSVANPINRAAAGWAAAGKGLPMAIARGMAVGAPTGAVYGAGGAAPGQMAQGAQTGATVGALMGGALPVAGAVAGKVGQAVAGAAPRIPGLRSVVAAATGISPADMVARQRLAAALAQDAKAGVDPRANVANFAGVSTPTLADVGGENLRATIRDAGSQGPPRNILQGYRGQVASDIQDHALALTRALTPGDTRTAPGVLQALDSSVADAATAPGLPTPGAGGQAVSAALNQRAAAAKTQVDAAYDAARAANPDQAMLPRSALPQIASNVRQSVADFAPLDIPRVTGNLGALDTLSTPTARDLFELRSRLSNLRVSADPVEAAAAGRATRALDGQIDLAHQNGQFTGDPAVVGLWRDANAQRRAYGQQFEGNDLIDALTARERHGAGMALGVAPEDASNAILGRSGVVPAADLTRDLTRMGDVLGPDTGALDTLRGEAAGRLLSKDAGTPNFGLAYQGFQANNPSLSGVLLDPGVTAHVAASRKALADAIMQKGSVNVGGGLLTAPPDQFAVDFGAAGDRGLAQLGGRQALADKIGGPREGALGALNTIATNTNTGRNLSTAYGDDATDAYRAGLAAEISRMENASYMAPNTGSQTDSRGKDFLAALMHGAHGAVNVAKVLLGGGPLSDAERMAIVQPGVSPVDDPLLAALLKAGRPPGLFTGSPYAIAPAAALSGQAAQ